MILSDTYVFGGHFAIHKEKSSQDSKVYLVLMNRSSSPNKNKWCLKNFGPSENTSATFQFHFFPLATKLLFCLWNAEAAKWSTFWYKGPDTQPPVLGSPSHRSILKVIIKLCSLPHESYKFYTEQNKLCHASLIHPRICEQNNFQMPF